MNKMNIIISGYGKMGSLFEAHAAEKNWNVKAIIDPSVSPKQTLRVTEIYKQAAELPEDLAKNCIAIDFSHPSCAYNNICEFAKKKIPAVVGTTGWYDKLDEVKKIVLVLIVFMLFLKTVYPWGWCRWTALQPVPVCPCGAGGCWSKPQVHLLRF
jgi:dihydrodipicolinate reductase